MVLQKANKVAFLFFISALLLIFSGCNINQPKGEEVNIDEILPKGAVTEITSAHPGFKVTLVEEEENANVSLTANGKFIRIDGIEEDERREKMAKYVIQYIENPNKKEEDAAKKKAFNELPPKEKLVSFVKRMEGHYPGFDYKWVSLGEGNVKVEYGDNSLVISGVENDGAREEIAHGIMRFQKEIDKMNKGEQDKK